MNKRLTSKIVKDVVYGDYKCPYCERQVPNYTFLTANGCVWCDIKYFEKQRKLKKRIKHE